MSSLAEKQAVLKLLRGTFEPVIIDLGAHLGEELQWMAAMEPLYVAVEADAQNYAMLSKLAGVYPIRAAIARESLPQRFYGAQNHQSRNRASGSIKKPTGHLVHFPEVTFEEPAIVPGLSLDDLFWHLETNKLIRHCDLLWVDIQGAERDMIAGGQEGLKRTRFMMIEAEPEVELYEGQALKEELLGLLPEWKMVQDFGYNVLLANQAYA